MKIRDVIKLLETNGWHLARTKGSHRQYKHPNKNGVVTIAGHLTDDVGKGTLNSILKQAGLKEVDKDV
jgi:predicted RNA binding protein YcfA (HicA-like mRNA interferase family)